MNITRPGRILVSAPGVRKDNDDELLLGVGVEASLHRLLSLREFATHADRLLRF